MTAETRRLASAAIDAHVAGDRVAYLVREIQLFRAVRNHAQGLEALRRIDDRLKAMERELYELQQRDRVRREGY